MAIAAMDVFPGCGLVPDHHSQSPRPVDRQTLSRAHLPPGGRRVRLLAVLAAVSCLMLPPLRGIAAPAGDQLQPWRRMEGTHQPVHHSHPFGGTAATDKQRKPLSSHSHSMRSQVRLHFTSAAFCRISAGLDRGGPKRNRARCTSPPGACTDWGRQGSQRAR